MENPPPPVTRTTPHAILEPLGRHLDVTNMPRGQRSDATPADPANRPLTERQRRLVEIALQAASDGRLLSRRQLGEASGFGSGDVARVQASRTLGLPHVRAAIVAGVREQAQTDAADSYATLRFIARKARSTRDRLGAAREVLSIAGVTGSEGGYTGPPVALQIVFRSPDAAALLQAAPVVHAVTQRPAVPHMAEE